MTAEELFFGESGTGPGGDLMGATTLAAQMVGSFGMAGTLLSFDAIEPGRSTRGSSRRCSATTRRRSVERILEQAKADVRNLLDTHRHLVVALRDALLETEELVGDEILDVLDTRRPSSTPDPHPTRSGWPMIRRVEVHGAVIVVGPDATEVGARRRAGEPGANGSER